MTGLEPATFDVTGQRSNQLSYIPIVLAAGLEPATLGLEIPCSIQLSYGRKACFLSSKTHWKMVCYSQILKCGLLATSLDRPILAR